jgi:hypothetical protein
MESGVAGRGDGGGLGDGGPVPQVMASGSECSESEAGRKSIMLATIIYFADVHRASRHSHCEQSTIPIHQSWSGGVT